MRTRELRTLVRTDHAPPFECFLMITTFSLALHLRPHVAYPPARQIRSSVKDYLMEPRSSCGRLQCFEKRVHALRPQFGAQVYRIFTAMWYFFRSTHAEYLARRHCTASATDSRGSTRIFQEPESTSTVRSSLHGPRGQRHVDVSDSGVLGLQTPTCSCGTGCDSDLKQVG